MKPMFSQNVEFFVSALHIIYRYLFEYTGREYIYLARIRNLDLF